MSKFKCSCGEVIRDQSDNLPYKGYLFADTEFFDLWDKISSDVSSYIAARMDGREEAWIDEYFSSNYPRLKDDEVVNDIMARHLIHNHLDTYQCSKCGRIHIERSDDPSRLVSFAPEERPHRDVFG